MSESIGSIDTESNNSFSPERLTSNKAMQEKIMQEQFEQYMKRTESIKVILKYVYES